MSNRTKPLKPGSTEPYECLRCLALVPQWHSPDSKECSDNCLMRYRKEIDALTAEVAALRTNSQQMADAAEMLWVVLASVHDWSQQSQEWQDAAVRWRDNYFKAVDALREGGTPMKSTVMDLAHALKRIAELEAELQTAREVTKSLGELLQESRENGRRWALVAQARRHAFDEAITRVVNLKQTENVLAVLKALRDAPLSKEPT